MDADELAFSGISLQADLIRDGEVSSRELVELYLERIGRLDPQLNSFRTVFAERALAEADQADARRGAGGERPLLGVPIAIKDEFDVAGEVTTMGTGAQITPAARDSEVVARLRRAGAIPIGMTTVPELTMWAFTETITWGQTRNPWDLERSPGGSSGGSAAAVAAGLVGAGVGSDSLGSIRIPAACCGLFGLKPQRGRVSYVPHDDHWHGLSAAGCLARRVSDTALFLDAVTGEDGSAARTGRSYVEAAQAAPGRLRIAVSTKAAPLLDPRIAPDVRRAVEDTAELLRSLGHDVRPRDPDYGSVTLGILPRYLRGVHDDVAVMDRPHRLERRTRAMARVGSRFGPALMRRVRAREDADRARVGALWEDHDVLLTPTIADRPLKVGEFEGCGALRTYLGNSALVVNLPVWNVLGLPAAAVPAGWRDDGLPLSVQLVGPADSEPTLLSLAAQLESERPWGDRRPPVA